MNRNLAVVGVGDWGKNLVRNFQAIEALLAVCDVDENRLKPYQERCPEVMIYSDFDKLLRNPEVKALAISTPATTHYALAKRALLEDRDVFIEKPISIRCREAEELLSLADERKRILMVGHILLYHPAISKLKGLMVSGELGKVRYIYSNRLNLGKIRTEENILWSFAPHDISAILYLLDEMPDSISANGGSYINRSVADVTVSNLSFPSGVRAHVFVSWLHPFKEQRLVVVGEKKMVLFNDVEPLKKLVVYEHTIEMAANGPVPKPQIGRHIETEPKEPLLLECRHFVECVQERTRPLTDGEEGLRVLQVLEASQASLEKNGRVIKLGTNKENKYFVHGSVEIDDSVSIGEGTKIWHFSHVLRNCIIGKNCVLGQNVSIGPNVVIGNNVKIQNNVSVYEGVTIEDDVFCGPSMVFTNVMNPRSHWPRKDEFKKTLVKKGASLGANSTILCGTTIGSYALVGAGSLVTKDIPDYSLAYGVPARIQGWICYCGVKLALSKSVHTNEEALCEGCGRRYRKHGLGVSEIQMDRG